MARRYDRGGRNRKLETNILHLMIEIAEVSGVGRYGPKPRTRLLCLDPFSRLGCNESHSLFHFSANKDRGLESIRPPRVTRRCLPKGGGGVKAAKLLRLNRVCSGHPSWRANIPQRTQGHDEGHIGVEATLDMTFRAGLLTRVYILGWPAMS